MTTPKKPLSKTESAIQLGNILKFSARGGGGKIKLRKIGEKASKVSKSKKIGEVQTRPKKSLQNQKPEGLSAGDKKYLKEIMKTPSFKEAQKEMKNPTPSGYGSKKNPNKKERELEKRFQQHKLRMKKK
tara:strand:+ start:692 stop:1078 length:387 start_codon:yes stop_codon:yes gene_type:complete